MVTLSETHAYSIVLVYRLTIRLKKVVSNPVSYSTSCSWAEWSIEVSVGQNNTTGDWISLNERTWSRSETNVQEDITVNWIPNAQFKVRRTTELFRSIQTFKWSAVTKQHAHPPNYHHMLLFTTGRQRSIRRRGHKYATLVMCLTHLKSNFFNVLVHVMLEFIWTKFVKVYKYVPLFMKKLFTCNKPTGS